MIGQIIGTFRIEQKIGEGGMGAVFRGHDLMLEREVAIKALRPELARQPELVARFRSEAVTLAKLNHSHIATLYNFLRHGEEYFMVMEFVRGKTLDEVIRQSGAMNIERAVRLFCQALEGIAHAHALGIIHRDIKPANLMLTANDEVKVMDFGIARVLGTARQTKTGRLIGTLEYMSPEQMRGAETDARSDIYSLGILLYEMLTGRVPFQADSDYELMRAQVEQTPLPPREFNGETPPAVEAAILQALAKDPAARFQSATEFRSALLSAVPAAALKPDPIHQAEAAPVLKATRVAANEIEWQSVDAPAPDIPSHRDSGFDRTTGTFTLRLPSFVLTAQEALKAQIGPLNWKHYGGAAAALLTIAISFYTLNGEAPTAPVKPTCCAPRPAPAPPLPEPAPSINIQAAEDHFSVPPASDPANTDPLRSQSTSPKRAAGKASSKGNAAPNPQPVRQQMAENNGSTRVPPSRPAASPQPSPTPNANKLDKTLHTVGKVAHAAKEIGGLFKRKK